jgi:polyhydroxyalkanoate synthesis regulator phasin
MFSAGFVKSQALLKEALAEGEAIRQRELAAQERSRKRLHAADMRALQAEVDDLRRYVAVLFQLLVARGVFSADEAKRLVAELETGEVSVATRDLVTGAVLPLEENPFRELTEPRRSKPRLRRAPPKSGVSGMGLFLRISVVLMLTIVAIRLFLWLYDDNGRIFVKLIKALT